MKLVHVIKKSQSLYTTWWDELRQIHIYFYTLWGYFGCSQEIYAILGPFPWSTTGNTANLIGKGPGWKRYNFLVTRILLLFLAHSKVQSPQLWLKIYTHFLFPQYLPAYIPYIIIYTDCIGSSKDAYCMYLHVRHWDFKNAIGFWICKIDP